MAEKTRRRGASNDASENGAASEQHMTQYVVLVLDEGRWHALGVYAGSRGEDAIKRGTLDDNGVHKPGSYRAVPLSTWAAEANSLVIEAETKVVNSFRKPERVA